MAFILTKDRPKNSPQEAKESWAKYYDYLETVKEKVTTQVLKKFVKIKNKL